MDARLIRESSQQWDAKKLYFLPGGKNLRLLNLKHTLFANFLIISDIVSDEMPGFFLKTVYICVEHV